MKSLTIAAGLLAASRAGAMTAEGTLITNVACGTFTDIASTASFAVSFCATATVLVVNPAVAISKTASPTMDCSGGTITFCIYVRNNSAYTSAFNVYLEDVIPQNMRYSAGQTYWAGATAGSTILFGYGSSSFPYTFLWNGFGAQPDSLIDGQTPNYAVRWIISPIGPGKSAMVCWKAVIQ